MTNMVYLLGRVESEISEKGNFIINVTKSSNDNIEYSDVKIEAKLIGQMVENVKQYCNIGDLVGIRGALSNEDDKLIVIVDKITFLSSKKGDEESE